MLTAAQEPLVHLPTEGQFLVCGAAGSGKSRVAIARALHLARQPLLHGAPKVLLLARAPASTSLPRNVEVAALAPWCRDFLARGEPSPDLLAPAEMAALVDAALELVRRRSRSQVLRRPLSFFVTELESMLLGLGAGTFADYTPVAREGRGSPLDDEARRTVFAVHEEFRALARALGKAAPLSFVAAAIARLRAERRPPYDHVVVDDAHRLTPIELKLARALASGGSLTLFSALEQKFDPIAASLRDLGLGQLDRTEVLPQMLRGTAAIGQAALAVLRRRGATGPELKSILPPQAVGAAPKLVLARGFEGELDALVAQVRRLRDEGRGLREIALLSAGELGLELAAAALARAQLATRRVRDDEAAASAPDDAKAPDAVALCALQDAAGREFPVVVVLDVNRGCYPRRPSSLAEHERATADDDARRALHLAMTRASAELVLLATEATRSPLLPMKQLVVERFEPSPASAAAVTP